MDRIEVDLLSSQANGAIVRLPSRKFPGIVVQGDSLAILQADAQKLADALAEQRPGQAVDQELIELAQDVAGELTGLLKRYEGALQHHRIPLPYLPNG